jgi:hypothetical protein
MSPLAIRSTLTPRYISLIFKIEVLFHLMNHLVNFLFRNRGEDAVVSVNNEDDVATEKYALVNIGLLESDCLETLGKVLIPYSSCLFLSIQVLKEL